MPAAQPITRREFLRRSSVATVSTALTAGRLCAAKPQRKPNVVLIMIDDLGAQALSCYGGTSYRTPSIDKLAASGMLFEHCHSMPMCGPSRAVLMTGKHRFRFPRAVPKDVRFMGNVFRDIGYRTGVAGKWMVGPLDPPGRGFDEALVQVNGYRYWDGAFVAFGSKGVLREINQPADATIRNEWAVPLGGGREKATLLEGQYAPEKLCDFACDFIRRHAAEPFLLYYPLKLVHAPFVPTPRSRHFTAKDKLIEHDPRLMGKITDLGDARFFSDMLAYADAIVSRVVDTLRQAGILDHTIVILTADNGLRPMKVADGVTQIPGSKGTTLDGATRVPLIVTWLAVVRPGSRCRDMVQFADFLPTLVDAAGAKLPPDEVFDGVSFLPQLRGQKGRPREWVYFHGGNHANPTSRALAGVVSYEYGRNSSALLRWVRDRRYKLYNDGRFHDLHTDYAERRPIPPGTASPVAEAERRKLQAVLDRYGDRSQWAEQWQSWVEPRHVYREPDAARSAGVTE